MDFVNFFVSFIQDDTPLGIDPDGAANKNNDNRSGSGAHGHAEREAPVKNGTGHADSGMKRPWF